MKTYQKLTPLQQQIYNLIVLEGTKTKDIALRLERSHHTVERNIEIILEVCEVDSQKELIVKHYTDIIKEIRLCPSFTKV